MGKFNARVQMKHDTEANWLKAANFIPLEGEIVFYDADETHSHARLKIGDGVKNINDLPFVQEGPYEHPEWGYSEKAKIVNFENDGVETYYLTLPYGTTIVKAEIIDFEDDNYPYVERDLSYFEQQDNADEKTITYYYYDSNLREDPRFYIQESSYIKIPREYLDNVSQYDMPEWGIGYGDMEIKYSEYAENDNGESIDILKLTEEEFNRIIKLEVYEPDTDQYVSIDINSYNEFDGTYYIYWNSPPCGPTAYLKTEVYHKIPRKYLDGVSSLEQPEWGRESTAESKTFYGDQRHNPVEDRSYPCFDMDKETYDNILDINPTVYFYNSYFAGEEEGDVEELVYSAPFSNFKYDEGSFEGGSKGVAYYSNYYDFDIPEFSYIKFSVTLEKTNIVKIPVEYLDIKTSNLEQPEWGKKVIETESKSYSANYDYRNGCFVPMDEETYKKVLAINPEVRVYQYNWDTGKAELNETVPFSSGKFMHYDVDPGEPEVPGVMFNYYDYYRIAFDVEFENAEIKRIPSEYLGTMEQPVWGLIGYEEVSEECGSSYGGYIYTEEGSVQVHIFDCTIEEFIELKKLEDAYVTVQSPGYETIETYPLSSDRFNIVTEYLPDVYSYYDYPCAIEFGVEDIITIHYPKKTPKYARIPTACLGDYEQPSWGKTEETEEVYMYAEFNDYEGVYSLDLTKAEWDWDKLIRIENYSYDDECWSESGTADWWKENYQDADRIDSEQELRAVFIGDALIKKIPAEYLFKYELPDWGKQKGKIKEFYFYHTANFMICEMSKDTYYSILEQNPWVTIIDGDWNEYGADFNSDYFYYDENAIDADDNRISGVVLDFSKFEYWPQEAYFFADTTFYVRIPKEYVETPTDKTLFLEGVAADSKAVGDALNNKQDKSKYSQPEWGLDSQTYSIEVDIYGSSYVYDENHNAYDVEMTQQEFDNIIGIYGDQYDNRSEVSGYFDLNYNPQTNICTLIYDNRDYTDYWEHGLYVKVKIDTYHKIPAEYLALPIEALNAIFTSASGSPSTYTCDVTPDQVYQALCDSKLVIAYEKITSDGTINQSFGANTISSNNKVIGVKCGRFTGYLTGVTSVNGVAVTAGWQFNTASSVNAEEVEF